MTEIQPNTSSTPPPNSQSNPLWKINRTIALVGLMGCGKSSAGKRLAKALGATFYDLDSEIELREKLSITQIFQQKGEAYFRTCEQAVLQDLLKLPPFILATGGGAFVEDATHSILQTQCCTLWLKASFDVLLGRVSRKNNRPILERGDKDEILKNLMEKRYPIYEKAHIHIESVNVPHPITTGKIIEALCEKHIIEEKAA
jgi:shikimate kinase